MEHTVLTERLSLTPLRHEDGDFILALLNTPGWLRFIGDRDVRTSEAAGSYIAGILMKPNVVYWVVRLTGADPPMGIITFIQRDYLEHPDIGFAFLPEAEKRGYAYEAANAILEKIKDDGRHPVILATTDAANTGSIRLLEKLGLAFDRMVHVDGNDLMVFSRRLT